MRNLNKYITFSLISLILFSCEEPSPIELINEDEEIELEILNTEPGTYVINGYDSTGIASSNSQAVSSLITFSGIKNSFEKITYYKAYAEAVFFDTTKPVRTNSGLLLGYRTFDVRSVKFNNKSAERLPLFVKFREDMLQKDTLLGNKYAVRYRSVLSPENLDFQYNINLAVEVTENDGNTNQLRIHVPDEIIGKVSVIGERELENLRVILNWNRSNITDDFPNIDLNEEIILGGKFKNRLELVPLFKLGKLRNNQFEIPNSLVEDILRSDKFEYLVITFLRRISNQNSINQLGDIRFVSQSIHNIWIKL